MWSFILYFFGAVIFFYAMGLLLSYVFLLWKAYTYGVRYNKWRKRDFRGIIDYSPFTPGVSIVAPAYNEEVTVVANVTTLLAQDYPKFEVIIVNDGSKDKTLERLIEHFHLHEVPYEYVEHVHCQPFKRLFRSSDPRFHRLVVVDKKNGGTKADAVNGGLNVARYPFFINTDVDCLLSRDAIFECVFPIMLRSNIIAVSGTMSMSNGMELGEDGQFKELKASNQLLPLFQDLEYKRSFLVGKMGWSAINAMPNVSGGYGLFDTQVVRAAGGYAFDSLAEDMDMVARMIIYCCDMGRPYQVVQIPHLCCWTEGPSTLRILNRQRTRWGRGLIQLFHQHRRVLFNPRYKRLGLITFPYLFIFEFLAPVIEIAGIAFLTYLVFTGGVNWETFWVMFLALYFFSVMLSVVVIFYDLLLSRSYKSHWQYLKLFVAAILEPFVYHPLVMFFSLKGYFNYIIGTRAVWGAMTRTGTGNPPAAAQQPPAPADGTPNRPAS